MSPTIPTILAVDDDPRNLRLVETLLRAGGYDVRCADSGAAALEAAAAAAPDLILLDLMMPGMDGFDVMRQLKADARTAEIPIIFLSAVDNDSALTRLRTAGAVEFLGKPIDRWALMSMVERLLGERARP